MVGRLLFKKMVEGYKKLKENEQTKPQQPQIILVQQPQVTEKKEEKKVEFEGIDIPDFSPRNVRIGSIETEETEKITLVYPLIPRKPKRNEVVYAYAKIEFNPEMHKYVYNVIEPPLTRELRRVLRRIKEIIEQKIDVDFTKLKKEEAKEYLHKQVSLAIEYLGLKLSKTEKEILMYYVDRDFIGLGKIEPLMHDPGIEDISCDGVGIPIFVFHRNPKLSSLVTDIKFESSEELDSFIIRLAQLCGKSVSIANPILDGSLPDGSRVQATLGTDIARRGSNFTIRKFPEEPLTPAHLLNWGTIDVKSLAYLWFSVDYGSSVILSGGTATGKTSFLNVLSLFIRPEYKIVSIEDTPELRLPHPHWVPHVARTPISTTGKEIDMFTLLKESLRQRPDYIIVGEVRGKEAYVMFQQMATGHAALATIHADSFEKLIDRLITPPIELPPSLLENLDIVVFLTKAKYRGKFVRRTKQILEIVGFDLEKNKPLVNEVFRWNSHNDRIEVLNRSHVLEKIKNKFGFTDKQIKDELKRRMLVLSWIKEKNLTDYRDVATLIHMYYNYPERVISAITGEI
ncbi:MAG: type II/IV secretion system ATPase subunit [Candidatus Aenigmarchaeota archaeon]|nr:type II/IV secretion system ATPase subunit [Candidatus Aenigmarchaeota archaeon]